MARTCDFENCGRKHYGRGYCVGHYNQSWRGQEMRPLKDDITDAERLWSKASRPDEASCWQWEASKYPAGYGQFYTKGGLVPAHRFAWELTYGAIPDGAQVDHVCHNRACINPGHLRLATNALNLQNRAALNRNNTSGHRGVTWKRGSKAWAAQAVLGGKRHHLGVYADKEEAARAATAWRREHMPYSIKDQEPTGSFFMPETTSTEEQK